MNGMVRRARGARTCSRVLARAAARSLRMQNSLAHAHVHTTIKYAFHEAFTDFSLPAPRRENRAGAKRQPSAAVLTRACAVNAGGYETDETAIYFNILTRGERLLSNYAAGLVALSDQAVVTDENGVPIPGATVEAVSDNESDPGAIYVDDLAEGVIGPVIEVFAVAEVVEDDFIDMSSEDVD